VSNPIGVGNIPDTFIILVICLSHQIKQD